MAFKPNGANIPNRFSKNNNGSQGSRAYDRLVTVVDYDTSKGIINVVDDKDRHFKVHLSKNAAERGNDILNKSEKARQGHESRYFRMSIDHRMEDYIPSGNRVIIKQAKIYKTVTENGNKVFLAECNSVDNVTTPSPNKTFEALYTVRMYDNRVRNVQVWDTNTIANDGSDTSNEALGALYEKFNENKRAQEDGAYLPNMGFQFRTIIPDYDVNDNSLKEEDKTWTVVDICPAFDYKAPERDDEGNVTKEGERVSGDWFAEVLQEYMNHINNEYPQEEYPALEVEVLNYNSYMATDNSINVKVEEHWKDNHPLKRLGKSRTKLSVNDPDTDESLTEGINYAVNGIVELTGKKLDKNTEEVYDTCLIKAIHYGGTIGHLHAFVRSSKGYKVNPHESLKAVNSYSNSNKVEPAGNNNTVENKQENSSIDEVNFNNSADNMLDDDPFSNNAEDVFSEGGNPEGVEESQTSNAPRFGGR